MARGGGTILRTFPENQEIHLLILVLTKLHSTTEIPAIELRWLNLKKIISGHWLSSNYRPVETKEK